MLEGSIEDVTVADLLQFIHLGARSGTLRLIRPEGTGQIGFHRGRIVSAQGPSSRRLGDLLVDCEALTADTLADALRRQASETPRRSLGQILLSDGAVTRDVLSDQLAKEMERTVYELVTWDRGTFAFAVDELEPIDEVGLSPGDVLPQFDLNTQVVVMEALRIFDERNRNGRAAGPRQVGESSSLDARSSTDVASGAETLVADEVAARGVLAEASDVPVAPAPRRLQVVSADRELLQSLKDLLQTSVARVTRVTLRDAGFPPPGEPAPVVLLDLREPSVTLDSLLALRRARPRAPIVAVAPPGLPVGPVYEAGALVCVPADPQLINAAFQNVVRYGEGAADSVIRSGVRAGFAKLRRVFADLRSGLVSATMSLHLMNIISDSVERAVLFLVRRDDLLALGAFGAGADGALLANVTQGLTVRPSESQLIADALSDGQVRTLPYDEATLPERLRVLLGRPRSGHCALFPVLGGQRVIAVIYADNGRRNRAIEELDILELATAQVGVAFENELLRRKVRQS